MLLKVVRVITGSRFRAGLVVASVVASVVVAGGVASGPSAAAAVIVCFTSTAEDINGDDFADAAIGEPGGGGTSALGGELHVLYGSPGGVNVIGAGEVADDQVFVGGVAGMPGTNTIGDGLGTRTLLADFNGDGCYDVAAGSSGSNGGAGAVTVLYGSPTGLTTTGATFLTEDSIAAGQAAPDEFFGGDLAAGDFNGDHITDLAIGAAGEAVVPGGVGRGAVAVAFGSDAGLKPPTALITQDTPGVPTASNDDEGFGFALAAGDTNADGVVDLAVGVPGESSSRGAVQVIPGGTTGLNPASTSSLTQNTAGVPGTAEIGDSFGEAVALGDVTGDGAKDLVVGAPGENLSAGAVSLLKGSASGITGAGAQTWTQNSTGIAGTSVRDDNFGFALTLGHINLDTFSDLAIGVPGDDVGTALAAGSVTVMRGSGSGLTATGSARYTQNTTGIPGTAETNDNFGFSVHLNGFGTDASGRPAHLLIGTPFEAVGAVADSGQVTQLRNTGSRLVTVNTPVFTLTTPGLNGADSHTNALFGWSVG